MITTEEIATRVYQLLESSPVKDMISGVIDYERNDYTKEDVIIVPHTIDGEGSVRYGQINLNIHVPDICTRRKGGTSVFRINFPRLIDIRSAVINELKSYYEIGSGYNWMIGRINPPIKEPERDEHFVTVVLDIVVRE